MDLGSLGVLSLRGKALLQAPERPAIVRMDLEGGAVDLSRLRRLFRFQENRAEDMACRDRPGFRLARAQPVLQRNGPAQVFFGCLDVPLRGGRTSLAACVAEGINAAAPATTKPATTAETAVDTCIALLLSLWLQ